MIVSTLSQRGAINFFYTMIDKENEMANSLKSKHFFETGNDIFDLRLLPKPELKAENPL